MSSEKLEVGNVNKTELIRAARKLAMYDLTYDHMADAFDSFMEAIREALMNGETVRLDGVGRLIPIVRPAGEARNPSTGKIVKVEARLAVKFSANTNLKLAMRDVDIKSLGNSGAAKQGNKGGSKKEEQAPAKGRTRTEAAPSRPARRAR